MRSRIGLVVLTIGLARAKATITLDPRVVAEGLVKGRLRTSVIENWPDSANAPHGRSAGMSEHDQTPSSHATKFNPEAMRNRPNVAHIVPRIRSSPGRWPEVSGRPWRRW